MKEYEEIWLSELDKSIEQELGRPDFLLEDLAKASATSPAQLYRRVVKLTGQSPKNYVRAKRLAKAKELLERGVYATVSEVATAVGYRHFHHFSTIYEDTFGKKPIDYLRENE